MKAVRASLVLSFMRILFRRSEFAISDQFRSSYLSAYVHIALRLVRESDSISRSSNSFRLSASRIAPSSAREFEAGFVSCPVMLSLIFLALPSAYHTPIPAIAFSHPLLTADPSVLIVVCHPLGSIVGFILGGSLLLMNGSLSFDLWPGILPEILIPPRMQ